MVKSGLEKQLTIKQGVTKKIPDFTGELIPAVLQPRNGKSPGNPVVEVTTPKGTTPHATTGGTPATQWLINLSEGTNKN